MPQVVITLRTGEPIPEHSVVHLDAEKNVALRARSATDRALGVAALSTIRFTGRDELGQPDVAAIQGSTATGKELAVVVGGLAFPIAGARVQCGEYCTADATGRVIPCTEAGQWAIGRALESVEAGQGVDFLVCPQPFTAAHHAAPTSATVPASKPAGAAKGGK
jgi:hypothetical protein